MPRQPSPRGSSAWRSRNARLRRLRTRRREKVTRQPQLRDHRGRGAKADRGRGNRTPDLRLKRPLLCLTELCPRAHDHLATIRLNRTTKRNAGRPRRASHTTPPQARMQGRRGGGRVIQFSRTGPGRASPQPPRSAARCPPRSAPSPWGRSPVGSGASCAGARPPCRRRHRFLRLHQGDHPGMMGLTSPSRADARFRLKPYITSGLLADASHLGGFYLPLLSKSLSKFL